MKPTKHNLIQPPQPFSLVQGDALGMLRHLEDESVDAIITDPPYSSGGRSLSERTASPSKKYVQSGVKVQRPDFHGDNKDQRSWLAWSTLWLSECWRVAKEGAPVCLFTDWRMLPSTTDALQAAGFIWRGVLPWDKGSGARPQPGRFRQQAEFVVWGSKGQLPLDRKVAVLPGVFTVPVKQSDKFHLTGKPTDLMRQVVHICEPGGIILDPFTGSGTTLVAAVMEGYRAIGVELSKAYARIAHDRLSTVIGRG